MNATRKLWAALTLLLVVSFGVLLWVGAKISESAPPVPIRVVGTDGEVVYTKADIEKGRQVWQSFGGMQLGSIWGHGAYVAPDWSADWLHREATAVLDVWAREEFAVESYSAASDELRGSLQSRLETRLRKNTYDATTGDVTLEPARVAAINSVAGHYERLFGRDPGTASLRDAYAMKDDTVPDAGHRHALTAFFWWTSWAGPIHSRWFALRRR